jgi:hypothetical protein
MRLRIKEASPPTASTTRAGARVAANDNRPCRAGIGPGLKSIALWHLGVFGLCGSLWFAAAVVTRLAQYLTGIRG